MPQNIPVFTPTCKAHLYVMIGAPGSGKSTFAKRLFPQSWYVSRDVIRYAMIGDGGYFSKEKETFREFINQIVVTSQKEGSCVVDASHLNYASRHKLLLALDHTELKDKYEVTFVYMDTPLYVCLERNAKRTGRECVPDEVIRDMFNHMTIPNQGEHPAVKGVWIIRE